jgi:hypothetical protein
VWISGCEQSVVDKAARERGVLPIDPEHLAKLARVPVHTAAAKEQERNRIAGTQRQLTILGEQNPILAGTELDQLAIRPSALRKNAVVAGGAEPPRKSAQHRVT